MTYVLVGTTQKVGEPVSRYSLFPSCERQSRRVSSDLQKRFRIERDNRKQFFGIGEHFLLDYRAQFFVAGPNWVLTIVIGFRTKHKVDDFVSEIFRVRDARCFLDLL